MARTRARKRSQNNTEEGSTNTDRWTISYMDMVTVMMCLFIVLFAISQVDQQKLRTLAESLGAAFGAEKSSVEVLDGSDGILDQSALRDANGSEMVTEGDDDSAIDGQATKAERQKVAYQMAQQQIAGMESLQKQIQAKLEERNLQGEVQMTITSRGLVIGLVSSNVFFSSSSAELTPEAEQVIDVLAEEIKKTDKDISVEGHANQLRPTKYETNWELSADRSVKVLRRMVEHGGLPANRIFASAYGDAYPVSTGSDANVVNRRADIVVISDVPEDVRDAIEQIIAARSE
ncbi:MAG: flagellar motor protein MotB [Ancrocorticia sp.]|jgi:chemotaxis protein MotB|nr:flagellar motor protein MotB [Ancrocorticia sp.]MCI2178340.1 flagellar motor protein MotB [Ancrocorticia sp.]MCI2193146.1 flagellar motor protein MotB [Ancrocorticia sp.]MCI2198854.1 flagellar motor protein MotB [Ancrocorticia sp.]